MAAEPYYAPTYFAPSFFYSATTSDPAPSSTSGSPYNAPTYFAPSYFYGASVPTPTPPPVVTEPQGRDQVPYSALLGLLVGTGVFEDVIYGAATQRGQAGADSYPLAIVTPKGWEESNDLDPALIVRRVTFAITITIKSQDASMQYGLLDQLSTTVMNVVDRSGLGGACLPALTRIRAGHYDYSVHYPEQSIELEGEFTSLIDPLANVAAPS